MSIGLAHALPARGPFKRVARLSIFASAVLSALLVSACTRSAAQAPEPPPPSVMVAEVISRDITEWDEFTGRLEAVNTVEVRPRVSGYVSAVRFVEGAIVRKGDLLFEIDARPFQAEVDRLRAEVERARATVDRAGTELVRAEALAAEQAMSSEEKERRASFKQESMANVAAVDAALRAAELNVEFTRVISPIEGRVGRAIITEGNLVSTGPGEATLLTTVVSLDPIYAAFDADEQTFLKYGELAREGKRASARQSGVPIRMALANESDFPHEGKMNFLDNRVNPETGTIRGRAVFRNSDRTLIPGLFVRIQLPGSAQYRALLVQDRAIGTDLDKRFVFVVTPDQTVQYSAVTLGPMFDGFRVVRSGLKPGDRVVVNGLQRVRPGAKVEPVIVAMDRPTTPLASADSTANSAQGSK